MQCKKAEKYGPIIKENKQARIRMSKNGYAHVVTHDVDLEDSFPGNNFN